MIKSNLTGYSERHTTHCYKPSYFYFHYQKMTKFDVEENEKKCLTPDFSVTNDVKIFLTKFMPGHIERVCIFTCLRN